MLKNKLSNLLKHRNVLSLVYGSIFAFFVTDVMAQTGQSLAEIVSTLQANIVTLGGFLTIVSYIAGIAFAIAGIVKFKAHKDNPTQVALSQPIVYLCVGAGLLFLPSIMASAGSTVFGSGQAVSAGKGSTGLE